MCVCPVDPTWDLRNVQYAKKANMYVQASEYGKAHGDKRMKKNFPPHVTSRLPYSAATILLLSLTHAHAYTHTLPSSFDFYFSSLLFRCSSPNTICAPFLLFFPVVLPDVGTGAGARGRHATSEAIRVFTYSRWHLMYVRSVGIT